MSKMYWELIRMVLIIKKKWCEYKMLRVQNKLLKKNYEIVKTYESLIKIKKNPPSFMRSLLYCIIHPISFIQYVKENKI